MRVVVAVVSIVAALSGCLFGEVPGIPCGSDKQCPSDHFCDVPNDECVAVSDVDSAPDLDVIGVRDPEGDVVIDPFVEGDVDSDLALVITNNGLRDANDVSLELTRLACMGLVFDPGDAPTRIGGGETVEVPFTVRPHLCSTPSIQDWFLFYSGRAKRGTFNINVQRAPPSPDD